MALEQIGLAAVLDDKNFQAGLSRYTKGIGQMTSLTDGAAKVLSGAFVAATGVAVAGIGAVVAAMKVGLDATMAWSENMDQLGDMFGMSGQQASMWTVAMNKVGLSLDEGAQGLNYFTRQLDEMKNAQAGAQTTTAKSAAEIAKLRQELDDANTRLSRAQHTLSEAKKPTDSMRWAVDDAQKAVNRLNIELGNAGKIVPTAQAKLTPFGEALKKLGISAYDSKGQLKTFDQIMPEIMDHFQKLPAGVNASALAMDLFGARGGSKFLDFLRQGSKGLKDATQLAKEFGLEMSTEEVDAAEQFGFALNELQLGFTGIKNSIGREVLPIAKRFVEWINANVIPKIVALAQRYAPLLNKALDALGDILGDLTSGRGLNALFRFYYLLEDTFGRDTAKKIYDVMTAVGKFKDEIAALAGRLQDAFKRGGLAGLGGQIVSELQKAWPAIQAQLSTWGSQFWNWLTGPGGAISQAQAKIQEFANKIGPALAAAWPVVSKQFTVWGTGFWDWLTGRGGAISQVAAKISEIAENIVYYLPDVWSKNIQPTLMQWAGQFWEWVTGKGGVISSVADSMGSLTQKIKEWTELPDTQAQFKEFGHTVAQYVLDGIKDLFSDRGKAGDNLILRLLSTMRDAAASLYESFKNLGTALATGIVTAIFELFVSPATAQYLANSLITALSSAIDTIIANSIPGLVARLWNAMLDYLMRLAGQGNTQLGPPPQRAPLGYANGGWVRETGMALVHRGEYVIPARQAQSIVNHNTRSIGAVTVTIQGSTGMGEAAIKRAVYQGITEVLGAA